MVSKKGVLGRQFENLKGSEFTAWPQIFLWGEAPLGHFLTKVPEGGFNVNFSLCTCYTLCVKFRWLSNVITAKYELSKFSNGITQYINFCLGWLLPSPFPLYRNTPDSWVIPLSWPKSKQTHVIVSVRNHHSKTHVIACVRKHRLRIGFNFAPGIPIWCNFVASVIHVDFECTWLVRNVTLLYRSFSSRSHAS